MKVHESPNGMPSIYSLLLLAFIGYAGMSVFISGPIFGSDEYAYYISGKFLPSINQLYELDPNLQKISNVLFFRFVHVVNVLDPDGFLNVFRILHALEYILAAYVLHQTFKKSIGEQNSIYGTSIFLLLPTSAYILAVMPEIDLILISALLGYTIINIFPTKSYVGSALAGVLVGISLLLKPHGLALLAAVVVAIGIRPSLKFTIGYVKHALQLIMVFGGFCYLTIIFLWKICVHQWIVDPRVVLGLKFYGSYIQASSVTSSFFHKLTLAIYYSSAHVVVLLLIFSPVFILFIRAIKNANEGTTTKFQAGDDSVRNAIFFVAVSLLSHVAMVSWFTAGAAATNEVEACRIHGRYLGAVICFLPYLYFYAISIFKDKELKLTIGLGLVALLLSIFFVFDEFKIFPWDYPLLFSFFRAPNAYRWDFPSSIEFLGDGLIFFLFAVIVLGVFFKKYLKYFLYAQLFVICAAGSAQTYNWVISHTKEHQNITKYSAVIRALTAPSNPGDGVLVSNERYGNDSFLLFGLGSAPKVIEIQEGAKINQNDILGAKWVLATHDYEPNFIYSNEVQLNQYKLYLINTDILIRTKEKIAIRSGQNVDLTLAANHNETKLSGFNEREQWGAWSSKREAKIELPFKLLGKFKIRFFAWTLDENLGTPVIIQLDNDSTKVKLSNVGEEYSVILRADSPNDFIVFESSIFHPNNSHRDMGIAISHISIEKLD